MSASSVFLDTNVLVYAFDQSSSDKQNRALDILTGSFSGVGIEDLVISTQVLQEFYVTVVRKLARPLSEESAEAAVERFSDLRVELIDEDLVLDAIRRSRKDKLSLWDSLVIGTALRAGCSRLLTEDLQNGRSFGSLSVQNPFLA
jgi:predicted nucleic acid-binding protein